MQPDGEAAPIHLRHELNGAVVLEFSDQRGISGWGNNLRWRSRNVVVAVPSVHAGCSSSRRWNSLVVGTPSTSSSIALVASVLWLRHGLDPR
jgi:hypothetical protein